MQEVIEILNKVKPGVNFEKEDDLITRGILTSFDILRLVNELNNEFDITITPLHIVPENFKNAQTIYNLVKKLQDED